MTRFAASNTLAVSFYDGRTPVPEPATLIWSGATVKVIGATVDKSYPARQLQVSPRVGRADRFVALPDGAQVQCRDSPLLARLPQEGRTEGFVAWLEQRWPVAAAALACTVASLALGYAYGLPALAERIAARVPITYERSLGEKTLSWLDENKLFLPSQVDRETQSELAAGFTKLATGLEQQPYLRLEFRNAPGVGPNAFALPGGIVVITDQMIALSESPEEVYAVLAHEIGHVQRRHAMRHIVQDSVTAAVAATFTSDVSSLTFAVSGIPVLLAQTKYSREFETEADDFAFQLLKKNDISPQYFASLMERLNAKRNPRTEGRMAFLSTHPVTAERIARARAAAAR
jgi:predicted Zn-dependent protease